MLLGAPIPSTYNHTENILPDCTTLITAINTIASVVSNPSTIVDLTGTVLPVTGMTLGDLTPILTDTGYASISLPSGVDIDGRLLKLTVAGRTHRVSTSSSTICGLWFGSDEDPNNDSPISNISGFQTGGSNGNFYKLFYFYWDSTVQSLIYSTDGSGPTSQFTSITSQSQVAFTLFGSTNGSSSDSVTVTEFKLEFA